MRRRVVGVFLGAAALVAADAFAAADIAYPTRPIRIIVPQSAGGSTDLIARVVADRMSQTLGQTIVVDNRPGAGSINGTELVARATPDGHTLLVVAASFGINPAIYRKLPYDALRDFIPITRFSTFPHIVVLHPSVPAKSVKELIALAKAKPGELNFASSGVGTSTHMAAELFLHLTGTKMVNVPYKGGGPGIIALIGGQVQLYFSTVSTALPHVRAGKLRALAVTSAKRSVAVPEFPTIAEAGVPGYAHASWVGAFAPAKTPRAIVTKLNAHAVKAVEPPEVKAELLKKGLEAETDTPEEFAALVKDEIAKWHRVVKAAGIERR